MTPWRSRSSFDFPERVFDALTSGNAATSTAATAPDGDSANDKDDTNAASRPRGSTGGSKRDGMDAADVDPCTL